MKISVILEADGDALAIPSLIAKTAELFGMQVFASHSIKSRGIHKLNRPGELERFVRLADQHVETEVTLIIVDLDDGCPVEYQDAFFKRIAQMDPLPAKEVRVCFCVREYECWFLQSIECLKVGAPDYDWIDVPNVENPQLIRDAKGELNKIMGRHYKPSIDQIKLTKKLDLGLLYHSDRSFRHFARAVTGLDYELLGESIPVG